MIHGTVTELKESLGGRDISIGVDVERSILVQGDETQYYTILQNLMNNARDAILERADADAAGVIEVGARVENGRCVIRVKDNGVGIKEEELERIFEVFDSTKPATGTGLGLAMVKKTVDVSGGAIDVQSVWGQGSQFTVVLPM